MYQGLLDKIYEDFSDLKDSEYKIIISECQKILGSDVAGFFGVSRESLQQTPSVVNKTVQAKDKPS